MNHSTQLIAGLAIAALVAACNKAPSTPEAEPSISPAPTTPVPDTPASPSSAPPSPPTSSPDATTSPSPGSMPPPGEPGSTNNTTNNAN